MPEFICYRFKGRKRRMVEAMLAELGRLQFRRHMGFRLRGYPETRARAQWALEGAPRPLMLAPVVTLRRWLLELKYNAARRYFETRQDQVAVTWNGLRSTRNVFMEGARDAGARCLFLERGPLPLTITVDSVGVNDRNSLSRSADFYKRWAASHATAGEWRALADKVQQRAAAVRRNGPLTGVPSNGPFIFVPLQKDSDTQLQIFGERCKSLADTIAVLAEASRHLPPGWHLRIKEHPNEPGSVAGTLRQYPDARIVLDNESDTFELVRRSALVLTVNSSVGLEAMLFEKPVVAMGRAFWAIDGVAARAPDAPTLATIMAAPDAIHFDPAARDAFLSFLVCEYYPQLLPLPDGRFEMADEERAKIARKLTPGYPAI